MQKFLSAALLAATLLVGVQLPAEAGAQKTSYPIVFAHGMNGYATQNGSYYFGDDLGYFVLDPCSFWGETDCVDPDQKSYVPAVQAFHNSEVRGTQLADRIEGYLATSGAQYVNIISHSQGGIDSRKAAKLLKDRLGRVVVKSHTSIASPHRGSPVAKYVLDYYNPLTVLGDAYGNSVYGQGNDVRQTLMQLSYDDYDPNDGVVTGAKAFNSSYPGDSSVISNSWSFMTSQNGIYVSPALWLVQSVYDIDGDGYCLDDCNGDGAAGTGNGTATDRDDDGVVGLNSQQMGNRVAYADSWWGLGSVAEKTDHGYVSDINHPTAQQMTSLTHVLDQDHQDVVSSSNDTFDEMDFYAAITDFLAKRGL